MALTPGRPGCRHLCDLLIDGQQAALWMMPDGEHRVLFDMHHFGNWHRNDLNGQEYRPTTDAVAAAATEALGYALRADDWGPQDAPDGALWYVSLECRHEEDHPEPWRTAQLHTVVPHRWEPPLRKHGVVYLGQLAALLESGKLSSVKGAPRKPARGFDRPEGDLLSCLRDSWTQGWRGWTGDMPTWLKEADHA